MLSKIMAVAKNEFRLNIRRGWPVVATATTCLILCLSTLFLAQRNIQNDASLQNLTSVESVIEMSWPGFLWLGLILLPMACAPSIPYDRQIKVHELICSMPITGWSFLIGKIIGVWGVVLLTSGACFLLHIVLFFLCIGPIALNLYLELAIIAVSPLLMWSAAFGVLSGAVLPNRKMAIIIGLFGGILSSFIWTLAFRDPPKSLAMNMPISLTNLITRQQSADFVFSKYGLLPAFVSPVTIQQLLMGFGFEVLILIIIMTLAHFWLSLREGLS